MIYLLAAALVIIPLVILDCVKRDKEEPTLLPYSVEPLGGTNKEERAAAREALKAPLSQTQQQPVPPQLQLPPISDGPKDALTSTTKNSTDKPSARTDKATSDKQQAQLPQRAGHYNSFGPRRRASSSVSGSGAQFQGNYDGVSCSPDGNPDRGRASPGRPVGRAQTPILRAQTPVGRISKKSKKSRKTNLPKSPSWKEFRTKTRATVTQSKTELTTLASNADGNKSALTAVSEYVFHDNKHKILGNVDQIINSDDLDVLGDALATNQSVTAISSTQRARSPFFDGQLSVWIADRVGSQAEG